MSDKKKFSIEIANPIYPKTNRVGSIIGPGTVPTRVVRIRAEDFIRDFNAEEAAAGIVLGGHNTARELGIEPKTLINLIQEMAR